MKICEYRYDTSIKENLLPRFNSNYNYVVVDYNEGNNIRRRVIESEEYPTSITFSEENSLTDVLFLDAQELNGINGMVKNCPNLKSFFMCNATKVKDMGWTFYMTPIINIHMKDCDFSQATSTTNFLGSGSTQTFTLERVRLNNISQQMIRQANKATSIILEGIDASEVTNASSMFAHCKGVVELDLTNWGLQKVTDMNNMFYGCANLTKVVMRNTTLKHLTNIQQLFYNCSNLQEVDFQGTSMPNIQHTVDVFNTCSQLRRIDLSSWGAKEVRDCGRMFSNCTSLTHADLSGIKTVSNGGINHLFYNCPSLEWVDLSNMQFNSQSNLQNAFTGCRDTLKDIGMIYCSSETINRIIDFNPANSYTIHYNSANKNELKEHNNCTHKYHEPVKDVNVLPPTDLTLRKVGEVCDEYDPLKSQLIQRVGEDGTILETPKRVKVSSAVLQGEGCKYGFSLPNGVADLYHIEDGIYEKFIDTLILNGQENWNKENGKTFYVAYDKGLSDTSIALVTLDRGIETITIINDRLTITFKDNSYVASNNLTLNAFKVWLQSNNIEFKYELKYNEYSKISLEELDFNEFHSDSLVGSRSSTITQTNKDDSVFAPITYQAKSNNRFELPLLESDVDYTIRYEGESTGINLGGEVISTVENNSVVQGGVGKVALFDNEVDELMLVEGDVRKQDFNYFRGMESVKQASVKTIGKNIFTDELLVNKDIKRELDGIEGYRPVTTSSNTPTNIDGFKIENCFHENTQYTFSFAYKQTDNMHHQIVYKYKDSDGAQSWKEVDGRVVFTSAKDKTLESLMVISRDQNATSTRVFIIYDVQLEISDVSTPYEPHASSTLTTPQDMILRSVDSVQDTLDCNTGEYVKRIDERPYQEGDEQDISVVTDFTKTQYVLETPITKTIDLEITQQNITGDKLFYHKDRQGQLTSNGTLPKFSYKLQSTNNYHAKDLKPNTTYTIYSDTESSVVNIGGKSNILLNSPQLVTSGSDGKNVRFEGVANDIVVIEGDVVNQVVPYFTGKIDVVNPIVKTIGGNNSNTVQTSVTLRSVNGVRDTYDMNTGVLTKRISDNHEILDYPQTITIPCDTPRIYSQGRIELSNNSDLSLLPRFEYSGKSPNFYPLAVDKNTTYTLKFDNTTNGGVTLGGTTVGTNGNQIITTKNNTLQGVLFERDLGIDNLMVIRGDVRDVPMSYFQGIKNVVNPTITLDNGGGESNSLTLTLTMRSLPNGTKDELNLVTGDYVQRLDERPYQEGDIESDNLLTDGVTTIYPLSSPRRRRLNLEWSNGVLKAFEGTTNVTSEAEMLKPYLVVKLATSTLEDLLSKLKEENTGLLATVDKLEEDNLTTMIAVTEVFETVLVMLPFRMDEGISMGSTLKGGGSQMVEVYVTLILKGKKTIDQVPVVIRSQVEQMLKDLQTL